MSVYERALKTVIALLLLAIATLVIAQVFFRFVLSNSLPWPEELGRLIFIYLVFIGGGLASLHGDHISIEAVDMAVEDTSRTAAVMQILREALMVLVMIVVIYGGFQVAPKAHSISLSATGLPKSLMTVPVIIGAVLMLGEAVRRIGVNVRHIRSASERTDAEET